MIKYFFRLDDIAQNMNWENFNLVVEIFRKNNIKPLIAVIPNVRDQKLLNYPFKADFWQTIRELRSSGWTIAQHGYQHLSDGNGGILKIHKSGEFGGIDFNDQENMINSGRKIMEIQELFPDVFVAPRHSFDKNTVKALEQSGFHFISDGIALWPFKKWGLVWLPQILWRPRKGMIGLVTVALHTNTMSREDLKNLENFIALNRQKLGDFSELISWYGNAGIFQKFLTNFINWPFKILWRIVFLYKHGVSK